VLGSTAPYDYLYTFWSDQYEHKIEYVGHVTKWDDFVVRGSVAEAKLIGFYLVDGVVRAAVGLDRGGDPELDLDGEMAACARLVSARARPAPMSRARSRRTSTRGTCGSPTRCPKARPARSRSGTSSRNRPW